MLQCIKIDYTGCSVEAATDSEGRWWASGGSKIAMEHAVAEHVLSVEIAKILMQVLTSSGDDKQYNNKYKKHLFDSMFTTICGAEYNGGEGTMRNYYRSCSNWRPRMSLHRMSIFAIFIGWA